MARPPACGGRAFCWLAAGRGLGVSGDGGVHGLGAVVAGVANYEEEERGSEGGTEGTGKEGEGVARAVGEEAAKERGEDGGGGHEGVGEADVGGALFLGGGELQEDGIGGGPVGDLPRAEQQEDCCEPLAGGCPPRDECAQGEGNGAEDHRQTVTPAVAEPAHDGAEEHLGDEHEAGVEADGDGREVVLGDGIDAVEGAAHEAKLYQPAADEIPDEVAVVAEQARQAAQEEGGALVGEAGGLVVRLAGGGEKAPGDAHRYRRDAEDRGEVDGRGEGGEQPTGEGGGDGTEQ